MRTYGWRNWLRSGFIACGAITLVSVTFSQTNSPSNTSTGNLQIVTLRREVNLNGLVKELGLKPRHMYRHALNGFAVALDSATIN
jgi:hypothetical protein